MLRYAILATLSSLTASCGLKGPLYLPDDGKEQIGAPGAATATQPGKRSTAPRPAPQRQNEDAATDETPGEESNRSVSPPDPDRPARTPPGAR